MRASKGGSGWTAGNPCTRPPQGCLARDASSKQATRPGRRGRRCGCTRTATRTRGSTSTGPAGCSPRERLLGTDVRLAAPCSAAAHLRCAADRGAVRSDDDAHRDAVLPAIDRMTLANRERRRRPVDGVEAHEDEEERRRSSTGRGGDRDGHRCPRPPHQSIALAMWLAERSLAVIRTFDAAIEQPWQQKCGEPLRRAIAARPAGSTHVAELQDISVRRPHHVATANAATT